MAELRQLLIATTNPDKVREFRDLLAGLPFTLVTPVEIGLALTVEETGSTFAENAELKARAYARAAQMLALADDSGLEIDALHGEPGIYSARWAGADVTYPERFRILAARLDGVPPARWTARYRCALAIAGPDRLHAVVEGTLEGVIAPAPRGTGGFGYDPIFLVPELGRTVGELSDAEKHAISHRARAALGARGVLERLAAQPDGAP